MFESSLIATARGSKANANSSGLSGQPCLVPLASGKGSERRPFVITLAVGEL